jgi:transcriptional regulator with XRE-family HTH domain
MLDKSSVSLYADSIKKVDALYNTVYAKELGLNAGTLGNYLKGMWFYSPHSSADFATLLGLEENLLEEYFEGKRLPKLEVLIRASKLFSVPIQDFFTANLYGQPAPWQNDLIKYVILQCVVPKRSIATISNSGEFYGALFFALARQLVELREVVTRQQYKGRPLAQDLVSGLRRQYYKVLELTEPDAPLFADEEPAPPTGFTPLEEVVRSFFSHNSEALARILVESLREITVRGKADFTFRFSFIDDLENGFVRRMGYDEQRFMMTDNSALN